jgi:hypothetical protein
MNKLIFSLHSLPTRCFISLPIFHLQFKDKNNVHGAFPYRCYVNVNAASIPLLLVHAAGCCACLCPYCILMLCVHTAFVCCWSLLPGMLPVRTAYLCCMPMLLSQAVCQCCISKWHVSECPCSMPMLRSRLHDMLLVHTAC